MGCICSAARRTRRSKSWSISPAGTAEPIRMGCCRSWSNPRRPETVTFVVPLPFTGEADVCSTAVLDATGCDERDRRGLQRMWRPDGQPLPVEHQAAEARGEGFGGWPGLDQLARGDCPRILRSLETRGRADA